MSTLYISHCAMATDTLWQILSRERDAPSKTETPLKQNAWTHPNTLPSQAQHKHSKQFPWEPLSDTKVSIATTATYQGVNLSHATKHPNFNSEQ